MDYISHLNFQINKLGYSFKNIDLLTEALTHSANNNLNRRSQLYENQDISASIFPPQNKTFNERLLAIGNNVLKFISSQYSMRLSPLGTDEGELALLRDRLLAFDKLNFIGEKLLSIDDEPFVYLRTNLQNRSKLINKNVVFGEFLKAVIGAVFIDAGGTEDGDEALKHCEKVFLHLWAMYLDTVDEDYNEDVEYPDDSKLRPLRACFFVPDEVRKFWLSQYDRIKKTDIFEKLDFIARLCEINLEIKFDNLDLLSEAITHKSFYEPVRNDPIIKKLHRPSFERLEFLGESAVGLVVSEFLYYINPNFFERKFPITNPGDRFDHCVSAAFQGQIADKYFLKKFIKMRDDINWKRFDQIVVALIGGLCVDGGIKKARDFIWREWCFTRNTSHSKQPRKKFKSHRTIY